MATDGVYLLGTRHQVANLTYIKVWAERGLVRVEDTRDGSYDILTVREALMRLRPILAIAACKPVKGQARGRSRDEYLDRRKALLNFADQVMAICRQCQEQGMPTDPSARRDLARRRATKVWVGQDVSTFHVVGKDRGAA